MEMILKKEQKEPDKALFLCHFLPILIVFYHTLCYIYIAINILQTRVGR